MVVVRTAFRKLTSKASATSTALEAPTSFPVSDTTPFGSCDSKFKFTNAVKYIKPQGFTVFPRRAISATEVLKSQSRLKVEPFSITVYQFKYRMHIMQRLYSSSSASNDEDAEQKSELMKKVGWLIKLLAAVTITYVSFNIFPIMGDSLIWQSVALVRLDDPFMKRSGASRISLIATNDRRRKGFVEAGGVLELTKMLQSAPDDKTRVEAVKALAALCECDIAVEALNGTNADVVLNSLLKGDSTNELEKQSLFLLQKLEEWRSNVGGTPNT